LRRFASFSRQLLAPDFAQAEASQRGRISSANILKNPAQGGG
jgi:hypothetical protein